MIPWMTLKSNLMMKLAMTMTMTTPKDVKPSHQPCHVPSQPAPLPSWWPRAAPWSPPFTKPAASPAVPPPRWANCARSATASSSCGKPTWCTKSRCTSNNRHWWIIKVMLSRLRMIIKMRRSFWIRSRKSLRRGSSSFCVVRMIISSKSAISKLKTKCCK